MKQKSTFTATGQMIAAVEGYLAARLCEQQIEPIVTKYEKEILGRHRFKAERVGQRGDEEIILDPKISYRMSDADSEVYFGECRKARGEARLTISGEDPDICPLLNARHKLILAENELIKSMGEIQQLASLGDKLFSLKLGDRKKLVDLSLKLVVPFINKERAVESALLTLKKYPRFAELDDLPE